MFEFIKSRQGHNENKYMPNNKYTISVFDGT